jgi:hypothetical protein
MPRRADLAAARIAALEADLARARERVEALERELRGNIEAAYKVGAYTGMAFASIDGRDVLRVRGLIDGRARSYASSTLDARHPLNADSVRSTTAAVKPAT